MNILQINRNVHTGGASRSMYRLHQAFQRLGHEAHILAASSQYAEPHVSTIYAHDGKGRFVHAAASRLDGWMSLPLVTRPTKKILDLTVFQQADVVNLHNLHDKYFDYRLLPSFSAQKPTVWTLHDMWAMTGHCAFAYECRRWQSGCHVCPLLQKQNRGLVEPSATYLDRTRSIWQTKRSLYGRSQLHIVTPSIWLLDKVKESILADAVSLQCIPYGIDTNVFRPIDQALARTALDLPLDVHVLLFAADNIDRERKGMDYLIETLKGLDASGSIVLLTMGKKGFSAEALQQFSRRDLGHLSDERLQVLAYNAADLFVFPTLADNLPLVLIEALACGLPSVSFSVGGVPEIVHHMQTGYLARYKDVVDLREGIISLLSDEALRSQMSHNCRQIAESEFALDQQAARYIDLYQRVLYE